MNPPKKYRFSLSTAALGVCQFWDCIEGDIKALDNWDAKINKYHIMPLKVQLDLRLFEVIDGREQIN